MCTVAFSPQPDGGYLLGHNRDELRRRARGLPPRRYARAERAFLAPRDPDGGGTWIGVHDGGMTFCLLNAAESDPSRLPPEPRSRGLVLWELLHLDRCHAVENHLDRNVRELADVRSFHLVVVEPGRDGSPARSTRFRWNGESLARDDHDGPTLYVSSSLYQSGVEKERGRSWSSLLERHPAPDTDTLRCWLASHDPERGPLSVCMHRPDARTVSRTLITVTPTTIHLAYTDAPPCSPPTPDLHLTL